MYKLFLKFNIKKTKIFKQIIKINNTTSKQMSSLMINGLEK